MTTSNNSLKNNSGWLDRKLPPFLTNIDIEKVIFAIIIILAIVSRFYILGARVMSHDEVNHVRPSWELYTGQGYRHDPVTHGPMQFHLVALSYLLLGDNDFTSRLPAALFSIATVMMMWKYRRYFGRVGALAAAVMMLISPYMLFYGRYTRNDAFVALWGVITVYAILHYLEDGSNKFLLLLAGIFSLQFVTKETSFIYAAQTLLFLLMVFLKRLYDKEWVDNSRKRPFLYGLIASTVLIVAAMVLGIMGGKTPATVDPAITTAITKPFIFSTLPVILAGIALVGILVAAYYLIRGLSFSEIRSERSFDLLILVGTFVLPQLTAFPIKLLGWNPLDYSMPGLLRTGIFLAIFIGISALIGIWWRPATWLKAAAIFYGIYIVLYTTIFTNGQGFFTGIIGSLGYWLEQQAVQRGSQPMYYYALVQIPMYEYLPAVGSLLGIIYAIRMWFTRSSRQPISLPQLREPDPEVRKEVVSPLFILTFLIFWVFTALAAYSYAGERMPWLTVHIAWPMILLAGFAFGLWIEKIDWSLILSKWGWLVVTMLILLVVSSARLVAAFLDPIPPFSGNTLEQLSSTTAFVFAVIFFLSAAGGLFYVFKRWTEFQYGYLFGAIVLAGLTFLTIRTSYRANYINYDTAKEYLVYAHAARGPKDIMAQIDEISQRITGGKNLKVAYDNSSLYPYWWYLRDYPNLDFFGEQPSKTLRDAPIVLVGNPNYAKVDPILEKDFYKFEYLRLWWPNQDYYNLTPDRVIGALKDPKIRAGIFDIWLNADYKQYAEATSNTTLTLETWEPAERIRLYIKKDIASQIWDLGLAPVAAPVVVDPYEKAKVILATGSGHRRPREGSRIIRCSEGCGIRSGWKHLYR